MELQKQLKGIYFSSDFLKALFYVTLGGVKAPLTSVLYFQLITITFLFLAEVKNEI